MCVYVYVLVGSMGESVCVPMIKIETVRVKHVVCHLLTGLKTFGHIQRNSRTFDIFLRS